MERGRRLHGDVAVAAKSGERAGGEEERNGKVKGKGKNGVLTAHRMLEDSSYNEVVRWGNEGDSFVVLEVCLLLPSLPF